MSAEGLPTYSAGDTIRVCVKVRPWPAGKGICRIRATFAHEADPTKEIELSDDPESRSEAMQPYLFAKARADERLEKSDLDYTIIRPGSLTNEEGTGRIDAAVSLGRHGEIPREDVARTFAAALEAENTYRKKFEILAGDTPIPEALKQI